MHLLRLMREIHTQETMTGEYKLILYGVQSLPKYISISLDGDSVKHMGEKNEQADKQKHVTSYFNPFI